jgi:DNA-binding transcriptional LysR family regulator
LIVSSGGNIRPANPVKATTRIGPTPYASPVTHWAPLASKFLPPKVRSFIDFLAERFGPEPYWDFDSKQT